MRIQYIIPNPNPNPNSDVSYSVPSSTAEAWRPVLLLATYYLLPTTYYLLLTTYYLLLTTCYLLLTTYYFQPRHGVQPYSFDTYENVILRGNVPTKALPPKYEDLVASLALSHAASKGCIANCSIQEVVQREAATRGISISSIQRGGRRGARTQLGLKNVSFLLERKAALAMVQKSALRQKSALKSAP